MVLIREAKWVGPFSAPDGAQGEPFEKITHSRRGQNSPQEGQADRGPKLGNDQHADEGPEHEDLPMGHIDDVQDTEDQGITQGHDGIDTAQGNAVDELFEEQESLPH